VNVQTLRFYKRRRLLQPRERALNGYRYYDEESVRLVRFIKHAQALGFSLREVQALLRLRHTADRSGLWQDGEPTWIVRPGPTRWTLFVSG
jgi:DNA-binding transcriptional MerR regulator